MSLFDRIRSKFANQRPAPAQVRVVDLLGVSATVGGVPTYELADTGKHDLATMLACCDAEESNYWKQPAGERMCAAPYCFERVAMLCRKAKDYQGEIAICKRWKAIAKDYGAQPSVRNGWGAQVHKGAREIALVNRAKKARELMAKASAKPKG